jgi:hypothetical protein
MAKAFASCCGVNLAVDIGGVLFRNGRGMVLRSGVGVRWIESRAAEEFASCCGVNLAVDIGGVLFPKWAEDGTSDWSGA